MIDFLDQHPRVNAFLLALLTVLTFGAVLYSRWANYFLLPRDMKCLMWLDDRSDTIIQMMKERLPYLGRSEVIIDEKCVLLQVNWGAGPSRYDLSIWDQDYSFTETGKELGEILGQFGYGQYFLGNSWLRSRKRAILRRFVEETHFDLRRRVVHFRPTPLRPPLLDLLQFEVAMSDLSKNEYDIGLRDDIIRHPKTTATLTKDPILS